MLSRSAVLTASAAILALFLPAGAIAASPPGALDARAFELVSPPGKNGGEVGAPGMAAAGILQAAAGGGGLAFGSSTSFGFTEGAAPVSQYLAARGAGGWATLNLTPPLLSGTYASGAYLLFSADLSREILSNGWSCREGEASCPAANPPLGSGAPLGYRNLYLREGGTYQPLITEANFPTLPAAPEDFQVALEGATPDLTHIIISADEGLYIWNGGQLTLLDPTPGASLAAPGGAISADGSRIYFAKGGDLYLHQGGTTLQVDEAQGGGGTFQTASADGAVAFFTKEAHLYRFDAPSEEAVDLTAAGGVQGVLGASADGADVYYLATAGLYRWHGGATTKVAAGADSTNYPPATGTARVTPDGSRLAFLSSASLTGYANVGKIEVFLYEAPTAHLLCASCRPSGNTPSGPSTISAAVGADGGPAAHKPRALSADGSRLFFDSADAVLPIDSDGRPDVYQWLAKGSGGCAKAAGCIGLVSGGRVGSASFADASADASDVFFATATPLLGADTGTDDLDLYDARAGGGFPEAPPAIPCFGDACQGPPPAPDDPTPGTTLPYGSPNSPVRFAKPKCKRHRPHRGDRSKQRRCHGQRAGRRGRR